MATRRRSTAAPEPEAAPAVRVLKKYPNRRLYDTQASAYVTLADVKAMVLAGEAFEVRDAKSGEDLTRAILLQIILEEETAGAPMFSTDMLQQIIRFCQPGLPQGADRLRAHPHPAQRRGLRNQQDLCRCRPGDRQHLRLHRRRGQGEPGHHRRGAGRERQGHRHRLPGRQGGESGGNLVQQVHPKVLAVTGPHATQEVMDAVHQHVPKPHDPFMDLVPERAPSFVAGRHQAHARTTPT
jgi:polyhydroxyalkanoate synthesis repressor PhaR